MRDDVSKFELKKLKRGSYPPEIYLDLHGHEPAPGQAGAGGPAHPVPKENIHVASVMHGIGKHILKQRILSWLAQHPLCAPFTRRRGGGGRAPSWCCWTSR